jgi:hypothetical protein
METITAILAKERMIHLAAFATYLESITPMTPDMVPLIIDTGASVSLSPYWSDFKSPIKPVQNVPTKVLLLV